MATTDEDLIGLTATATMAGLRHQGMHETRDGSECQPRGLLGQVVQIRVTQAVLFRGRPAHTSVRWSIAAS